MHRPDTLPARTLAALIALVAAASLILQFLHMTGAEGQSAIAAIWEMARFLTILTTVLVAITFAKIALGRSNPDARWLAALTLAMGLVAVAYHLLLSGINEPQGLEIPADIGFHSLGPGLVALWWLVFAPKSRLVLTDLPIFLIWPAIYVSYALTRGGIDGVFPYPFLDPLAIGWNRVLWTVAQFTLAIAIVGAAMVLLGRALDRR